MASVIDQERVRRQVAGVDYAVQQVGCGWRLTHAHHMLPRQAPDSFIGQYIGQPCQVLLYGRQVRKILTMLVLVDPYQDSSRSQWVRQAQARHDGSELSAPSGSAVSSVFATLPSVSGSPLETVTVTVMVSMRTSGARERFDRHNPIAATSVLTAAIELDSTTLIKSSPGPIAPGCSTGACID